MILGGDIVEQNREMTGERYMAFLGYCSCFSFDFTNKNLKNEGVHLHSIMFNPIPPKLNPVHSFVFRSHLICELSPLLCDLISL